MSFLPYIFKSKRIKPRIRIVRHFMSSRYCITPGNYEPYNQFAKELIQQMEYMDDVRQLDFAYRMGCGPDTLAWMKIKYRNTDLTPVNSASILKIGCASVSTF